MILISLFGLWIVANCIVILARPATWHDWALGYIEWRWMHVFEILLNGGVGLLMIYFADDTRTPAGVHAFGWFLFVVGLVLTVTPPAQHRRFGRWSLARFRPWLRWAALPALALGGWLTWTGLPAG